jgi:hypothetical protein
MEDIGGLIERMPEHRALSEPFVRPFASLTPAGRASDPTESIAAPLDETRGAGRVRQARRR